MKGKGEKHSERGREERNEPRRQRKHGGRWPGCHGCAPSHDGRRHARESQQPLLITGRKQGSSGGGRILQPEVALRRPSRHRALADDNGHESGFPPSSTGTILVCKLFWKILVTRVNRRFAARANSFGSPAWGACRRRHVGPSRRLQFAPPAGRSERLRALATRDESRTSLLSIRATSYSLISRL